VLQAQPYERCEGRLGHANGFKSKTLATRMGAVELRIPAATVEMESTFRSLHTDLACSLLEEGQENILGKDHSKWTRRAIGQIETARQYLFGDAFRSLLDTSAEPTRKARGRKAALSL
jgi:hypothetical protein